MYSLHREISVTAGSASSFSRNLTLTSDVKGGQTYAAVCAKNHLCTVGWEPKMEGMTQDMVAVVDPTMLAVAGGKFLAVLQAKYCSVETRKEPLLVVCTTTGVVIYDWNGSTTLQWQPIPKPSEDDDFSYTKGIDVHSDHVCVGNSLGEMLIFSVKNELVKLRATRKEHKSPLVDLFSDGSSLMASVSMDGIIMVWDGTFKLINKIDTELAVNCVAVYKSLVFAATVLGGIFIYNPTNAELLCEIAAHARPINALDVAQDAGLLLSLSEDSFARVWEIKKLEPLDLDCVHSEVVPNVPLTGGCFTDSKGSAFACTGFDYSSIFYYKKIKPDGKTKK